MEQPSIGNSRLFRILFGFFEQRTMSSFEPKPVPKIFTIGHGTLDIDSFTGLLDQFHIEMVVDVRSAPYSNYVRHFNRESLEASLRQKDYAYRYAGAYLGGRPRDPACYRSGTVPDNPRADYLRLVDYEAVGRTDWYRSGIDGILELAEQSVTAILCSEEDPLRCHRHHLIAVSLIERGMDVEHIRHGGSVCNALEMMSNSSASSVEARAEQLALL